MTTDNAQPNLELARSLKSEHKLKKALKICNAVIATHPNLAEAHQLRGTILVELDRKNEALAAFQEAIRLKPNLVEAQESLRSLPHGLKPANIGTLHTHFPLGQIGVEHGKMGQVCERRRPGCRQPLLLFSQRSACK